MTRFKINKTFSLFSTVTFLCFSLTSSAQIPNTSLNSLKVMTWNIWYGFSQLELSNGILPEGHPFIANQATVQQKATDFLLSEAPDVIAFQELKNFDETKLATFSASYGHGYSILFDRDTQQATGISSKYPLTYLEGNHENYNGTNLEGTFAAKLQNEPIVFIVVHLKSSNKNHRAKETNYVLELYKKYIDLNNHVVILGDFNSMSIHDRTYAESKINTRLQYRIFKNKCNHDMNKANEPDIGNAACSTWDYGVMEKYWDYAENNIQDTTYEYSDRTSYENSSLWGTFPTTSVSLFHDSSNLDHNGEATTTHTQAEHLARIDYVLANDALANLTTDARILHQYTNSHNQTVLIDEMTDHYPLCTTFTSAGELSIKNKNHTQTKLYPNPNHNGILKIKSHAKKLNTVVAYNVLGEKIKTFTIKKNQIDISNLKKGIYFFRIDNLFSESIIIK